MLTIGIATYDDFDGLWFTVQSLRLHHDLTDCEIIVVDNNPTSTQGEATKAFVEGGCKGIGRYVAFPEPKGSCPPRGHIFEIATKPYVLVLDCHVLLPPGTIEHLKAWYRRHPDSNDLIHGPMLSKNFADPPQTHMRPIWGSSMYGRWGQDDRGNSPEGEPFEIPMHGLGLFSCRREAWPGFHPGLKGFSGGEGYIHEKFRQRGGRVLCHPGVRWLHRFERPGGCLHKPQIADKIRNILLGWSELGMDLQAVVDHFVGGEGMKDGKPRVSARRMEELMQACGIDMEVKVTPRPTTLSGLVVGPYRWPTFELRGRPLANHLGWPTQNGRGKVQLEHHADVAVVVKTDVPRCLFERCTRVIWDPMDVFTSDSRSLRSDPAEYWATKYRQAPFGEIIGTSPAVCDTMRAGLPGVRVYMVPHAPDRRVQSGWHDPGGPIVYAGLSCFVESIRPTVDAAAAKIGRNVRWDHSSESWKSLQGAALGLCPRVPPHDLHFNRIGKPQIKVANASAAGVPVLCTDDPGITSVWHDVPTAPAAHWLDPELLAQHLTRALDSEPPPLLLSHDDWLARMSRIINSP